ncbi:hypothetical protein CG395_06810, partial [Bifidobacteriaceae bacterium GH022]
VEKKGDVYVKTENGKKLAATADEDARTEFLGKQEAAKTTAANAAAAQKTLDAATADFNKADAALDAYKPAPEVKKSDPSDATYKAALVKTSGDFDEANAKLEKAYAKYDAAYSEWKDAKAKYDDAKAALDRFDTAHDELTKSEALEKAELKNAVDTADAAVKLAKATKDKAKGEMDKALDAAKKAWSAYNQAYAAAKFKNAEFVAGYALPGDIKPLDEKYVPGVSHVTPGSVKPGQAGKPGAAKPGQAAGQAGANGAAAGSKTEVENKKDKDKRGNTHTGT